eukprot:TRINITY_DN6166_c0_g4_i2.p1 TRINITY_DN6166_c0_g4~~TRINITY_DN6166_c0_g4_i2.p1  ORF type:complete len:241 (-),score=28.72 TRINITY_DN6166_c0_g4_i2:13-735(-)
MIPDMRVIVDRVDVYCWAVTFYSILFKQTADNLYDDNEMYKLSTNLDYNKYLEVVRKKFEFIKSATPVEKNIKEMVKRLIVDSSSFVPKERLTMEQIVDSMKTFEQKENFKIKYSEIEAEMNKHFLKLLLIDVKEPKDEKVEEEKKISRSANTKELKVETLEESEPDIEESEEVSIKPLCESCMDCPRKETLKGRLACGHVVCKDCVVEFTMKSLLKKSHMGTLVCALHAKRKCICRVLC